MNPRALVVLAIGMAGCSSPSGDALPTFPSAPLMTTKGDEGVLAIEVRTSPEQPPSRGTDAIQLVVRDDQGRARDGLGIAATPWMPDMGHGASVVPDLHVEAGGVYVLTDVAMFMPGRWQLRTTFSGAASDHVTIEFQIP